MRIISWFAWIDFTKASVMRLMLLLSVPRFIVSNHGLKTVEYLKVEQISLRSNFKTVYHMQIKYKILPFNSESHKSEDIISMSKFQAAELVNKQLTLESDSGAPGGGQNSPLVAV